MILDNILPILGGTFDPIHNGHLRLALDLYQDLNLSKICLIPNAHPPHRAQPLATAQHRFKMLQLAIKNTPELFISEIELSRSGPSYFIDTLLELKIIYPHKILLTILGMDAFFNLPAWHRWEELFNFTNFLLVHRPDFNIPNQHPMLELLFQNQVNNLENLINSKKYGLIYQQNLSPLHISATQIRELIKNQKSPQFLLPDLVWDYIRQHNLYGYHGYRGDL